MRITKSDIIARYSFLPVKFLLILMQIEVEIRIDNLLGIADKWSI